MQRVKLRQDRWTWFKWNLTWNLNSDSNNRILCQREANFDVFLLFSYYAQAQSLWFHEALTVLCTRLPPSMTPNCVVTSDNGERTFRTYWIIHYRKCTIKCSFCTLKKIAGKRVDILWRQVIIIENRRNLLYQYSHILRVCLVL